MVKKLCVRSSIATSAPENLEFGETKDQKRASGYTGSEEFKLSPCFDFLVSLLSCSFTNQVIAQLELWNERKTDRYEKKVYVLPKHLDEKVAALHLGKLGAKLSKLSKDQADLRVLTSLLIAGSKREHKD